MAGSAPTDKEQFTAYTELCKFFGKQVGDLDSEDFQQLSPQALYQLQDYVQMAMYKKMTQAK